MSGQEKVFVIDRTEGPFSVKYVMQTENSTLVYCMYSQPESDTQYNLVNISRGMNASAEDMTFKLLNAYNMAVKDEAVNEYALLRTAGQKLDFVMEFERIPDGMSFDILDAGDTSSVFNMRDVVVDTTSVADIDTKAFIESTPYEKYGRYIEADLVREYYECEGLAFFVEQGERYSYSWDSYQSALISFVNKTDRPVNFDSGSLEADGIFLKRKDKYKSYKPEILSKEKCDKKWFEMDEYEVRSKMQSNPGEIAGETLAFAGVSMRPSLLSLGVLALGALVNEASKSDVSQYMVEMNEEREKGMKEYMESRTVNPGETYQCFVTFKQGHDHYSMSFVFDMEGKQYKFTW